MIRKMNIVASYAPVLQAQPISELTQKFINEMEKKQIQMAFNDFNYQLASIAGMTYCNPIKNITKDIKRVIFNDPATIVYWNNNTKTVVKAQNGEPFDKEKGLALCIVKRLCGDKGNFNNVLKKWCD